MLWSWRFS